MCRSDGGGLGSTCGPGLCDATTGAVAYTRCGGVVSAAKRARALRYGPYVGVGPPRRRHFIVLVLYRNVAVRPAARHNRVLAEVKKRLWVESSSKSLADTQMGRIEVTE